MTTTSPAGTDSPGQVGRSPIWFGSPPRVMSLRTDHRRGIGTAWTKCPVKGSITPSMAASHFTDLMA